MKCRIALAIILLGLGAAGARAADVHINIGVPPPPQIVVAQPPQLVIVPRTPVYYAPDVPYNYFYYDGRYYTNHEGAWFYSSASSGPWVYVALGSVPRPIRTVPVRYYKV